MSRLDEARPRFVDGIGPPLQQIQDDHKFQSATSSRDILALIDEVARLDAALRVERERNERLHAVVEAAQCYRQNQMAYERNVLFDALDAVLAEQEKEQP